MAATTATLTIGEVAREAGLNASAIRFYEDRGVLPQPERVSGQRRYTRDAIRRLEIVDIAKRAGFSLDDVRTLLLASDDGAPAHEHLRDFAQRKLPEIRALIERAEAMERWLTTATGCGCSSIDDCRLFDAASALPVQLNVVRCG